MQRPSFDRQFELRPRGMYRPRGPRRGSGNFRGRGGRNENSTQRIINVSSDGATLHYSRFGTDTLGDPSLVQSVIDSRKVIGEYSEDSERNFVNDRSYLHFLLPNYLPDAEIKEKVVDLDLKVSETETEEYTSTGSKDLENFLTWIINNQNLFYKEIGYPTSSKEGGKFVTMKSVLSNLLAVPYRINNEFKIYAFSFNGVVYMQKEYKSNVNDKIAIWAHKFEQYLTEEATNRGLSCNEEFRAVISNNLGPHRLLFSSSLDCAIPEEFEDDFKDLSSFVTLKCLEKADIFNYRFQMMYWYMTYVVSGVPKTLLGQRDENGIVTMLRLYDAQDMLQLGKEFWNPVNCLYFTSEVLSFIKNNVESDPGSVFCISKKSREAAITCTKEHEYENFLPEWFIQEINETKVSDVDDDANKSVLE